MREPPLTASVQVVSRLGDGTARTIGEIFAVPVQPDTHPKCRCGFPSIQPCFSVECQHSPRWLAAAVSSPEPSDANCTCAFVAALIG